jgi:hypothetical protein
MIVVVDSHYIAQTAFGIQQFTILVDVIKKIFEAKKRLLVILEILVYRPYITNNIQYMYINNY